MPWPAYKSSEQKGLIPNYKRLKPNIRKMVNKNAFIPLACGSHRQATANAYAPFVEYSKTVSNGLNSSRSLRSAKISLI